MVQINFAKREINCKLVYYGPGLSGKTTNVEVVHKKAPASKKGELTSIATHPMVQLAFTLETLFARKDDLDMEIGVSIAKLPESRA